MKNEAKASKLVAMGVIGGAHGIRGEVKLRSFAEDPKDITAYGALTDAQGKIYKITVTGGTKDALIARVEGVADRNQAELLRNIELFVPRSALPKTASGEYYHEDLAGLAVVTESGEAYGTIAGVHNFGAGPVLVVRRSSGDEDYLPFSRKIFPSIDIEAGKAVIIPPEIEAAPDA